MDKLHICMNYISSEIFKTETYGMDCAKQRCQRGDDMNTTLG
jgi:hypothetical protein